MGKSRDRKRLEKLARQKVQERERAETAKEQERAAAERNRKARDAKTDELFKWCEATFAGYRLPGVQCEVRVSRAAWAEACNILAYLGNNRLPSGAGYVSLGVAPVAAKSNGLARRLFVLALVRYGGPHWEIIEETKLSSVPTLEYLKDHLIELVAGLSAERLSQALETSHKAAGKPHSYHHP
jgi:hypothetical protein